MSTSGNDGRHDSKRRTFLKIGGAVGAGAVGGGVALTALFPKQARTAGGHHASAPAVTTSAINTITPFVDALPIPSVITTNQTLNGVPLYNVTMKPFLAKVHRDLPATPSWGYNGQFPPTFNVQSGKPIAVKWNNALPGTHFLPIDPTIHGAEPPTPQVRTVVHLHGSPSMPESDGYPEAWFTNGFKQTGPFFTTQVYNYPNNIRATQLWYHDHALGITRLNVYAGLGGGNYFVRDAHEASLGLPSGRYEIPLVLQDRFFNSDGSLLYPVEDNGGDPDPRVPPIWTPEFFGDTALVNGKAFPYLEVEPRRYRFRMLNASNSRFWHLTLAEGMGTGQLVASRPTTPPPFIQIGSDGGFLGSPLHSTDLLIAPAERFDLIIDFTHYAGKNFVMLNDGPAPFPGGGEVVPPYVMMFKVNQPLNGTDKSRVPSTLTTDIPNYKPSQAVAVRDLVLTELDSADPFGNPIIGQINGAHWDDPVTESPKAGTVEMWRIINATGDGHPIHVHLVQFQVLDVTPYDTNQYPPNLVLGQSSPPPANQQHAWKDTVISLPGQVTRIIAKYDLPAAANPRPGEKFRYIYHCHILEHEENEMMRPYDVIA
jgi:spore coat protein A